MNVETIVLKELGIGYPSKNGVRVVAEHISANGVGKSTLLRTLSAFQPKIAGEILFAEDNGLQSREISEMSDKELSHKIGVVLTEKPDVRNMTVRELVSLGRSPYTGFWGTYSEEDMQIVDESIALVGIESLTKRMVHTLSDGERQKVMIAKALAQQTPVIYLDEPTAFLDYPSKVEVLQLLRHISRQAGKTIFLSTHDVELALQLADTIWLMTRETEMTIGTPQELAQQGALGRFIERKGIVFDPMTLSIRIVKNN